MFRKVSRRDKISRPDDIIVTRPAKISGQDGISLVCNISTYETIFRSVQSERLSSLICLGITVFFTL